MTFTKLPICRAVAGGTSLLPAAPEKRAGMGMPGAAQEGRVLS